MISIGLSNQVAMVTGAGGEVGGALSLDLAGLGTGIVLICRGSRARCEKLTDQIKEMGRRACVLQGDVSHSEGCSRMAEEAIEFYSKLVQILVNDAGYFYDVAPLVEMSDDQMSNTTDINLKGAMYMLREICRRLVDTGTPGRVINITSDAAHSGRVNFSNYCASKTRILGLTRAMALELTPTHINVNSVSAGYVEIGRWEGDPSKDTVRANIIPRIPLRRPGVPRGTSRMVCLLTSECGDWITGSDFIIGGGESYERISFAD